MSSLINVRKAIPDDIDAVVDLYMENADPSWTTLTREAMKMGISKLISDPDKGYQIVAESEKLIIKRDAMHTY